MKELGYLKVCVNGLWIALLFLGVAAAATALDKHLPRSKVNPSGESTGDRRTSQG